MILKMLVQHRTFRYAEKMGRHTVGENKWCMSNYCVLNPEKPGKYRVVFDCAGKFQGNSFNDRLLQGPD